MSETDTIPIPARIVETRRKTAETEISLRINLDGSGRCSSNTDIPFFDHMLNHISRHGLIDIDLNLKGDIEIDCHHSVEDTALVFGQLINEALGEKRGINRYGHFTLPMDEVLTTVALDLGGRFSFKYSGPDSIKTGRFGIYDAELTLEFLEKFAMQSRMNLHVNIQYGENRHHLHESIFKALGRALKMAVAVDDRLQGSIPSTKEVL